MTSNMDERPYIEVRNLKKYFSNKRNSLRRGKEPVKAVDGVTFSISKGETFGLVGESGSGKTTLGKSILRLIEPTSGTVKINGDDIIKLDKSNLRHFRANAQIVFQDPSSSLNPKQTVGNLISKPLVIHKDLSARERNEKVDDLLKEVGLNPNEYKHKYPSQLSGGEKQRVGIARAISINPEFIILDEPTSALDVSVQARLITLLKNLQKRHDLTYLFITHDLALLRNVADRIGVMYLGKLVEIGSVKSIYSNPQHPYTMSLLSAIFVINDSEQELKPTELIAEGEVPDPRDRPSGCGFRNRCPKSFDSCSKIEPKHYEVSDGHTASCLLHDETILDNPGY